MENNFKLILKQNDETIMTSIFDSSQYSSRTLQSIDVRNILPKIFKNINQVASTRKLDYKFNNYDFLDYYKKESKNLEEQYSKLSSPDIRSIEIKDVEVKGELKDIEIKGVELLLGFYINNKTIFERSVYVENYNKNFRFSTELHDMMKTIEKTLLYQIKKHDVVNIYNENREYLNG